jgi:hypothetical protein
VELFVAAVSLLDTPPDDREAVKRPVVTKNPVLVVRIEVLVICE